MRVFCANNLQEKYGSWCLCGTVITSPQQQDQQQHWLTTLAEAHSHLCFSAPSVVCLTYKAPFFKTTIWRQHKVKHHRSVAAPSSQMRPSTCQRASSCLAEVLKYIQKWLCFNSSNEEVTLSLSDPKTLQCVLSKLHPQFVLRLSQMATKLFTNGASVRSFGPNFCRFCVVYSLPIWLVQPFSRTLSALQLLAWPYLTKSWQRCLGLLLVPLFFLNIPIRLFWLRHL